MKRYILGTAIICALGFIGCTTNSTKSHAAFQEGYDCLGFGSTYVNTFKDSKGRPHKVITFCCNHGGLAAVDLDASTYRE